MLNLRGNSDGQRVDAASVLDEALEHVVSPKFDLIERRKGDFTIMAPKGQLNNATLKLFRKAVYAATDEYGCKVIYSLRFVDLIDSVGLGVLITAHKNADAHGGMIVFTDMNDRISNTMKMLYMDKYLNITADMRGAKELLDW